MILSAFSEAVFFLIQETKLALVKHTILFELQNRRYYNEATGGRYVPRAILMDLEPGTMVRRLLAQVIRNRDIDQTYETAGMSSARSHPELRTIRSWLHRSGSQCS